MHAPPLIRGTCKGENGDIGSDEISHFLGGEMFSVESVHLIGDSHEDTHSHYKHARGLSQLVESTRFLSRNRASILAQEAYTHSPQ